MSGSACRIDHLQFQDGLAGIGVLLFNCLLQHWIKRGANEFVDQDCGCVVRAGQLASESPALLVALVADEPEPPRRRVHVHGGVILQQTLVYGPEFLRAHVPIVDPCQSLFPPKVAQMPNSLQQMPVLDHGAVKVGAMLFPE